MHSLLSPRERYRLLRQRKTQQEEKDLLDESRVSLRSDKKRKVIPTIDVKVSVKLRRNRISARIDFDDVEMYNFEFAVEEPYRALKGPIAQAAACLQCLHDISIIPIITHPHIKTRILVVPTVEVLMNIQKAVRSSNQQYGLDRRGNTIIGFGILRDLYNRAQHLNVDLRSS